jgi:aminoglycoside 6'-N-acetyltransferase I
LKNGETWAKSSGISQIASDTEVENVESIAFYKKAGFSEVNRVVCFIKDL